ncbi:NUDIX domain-containing protein [Geobacter argillaceus]|uniref:8-oxo-dGTP diphosphatase n=1 Tax=Geobacter argillaceus TaxID=345631 RepID=A0A562W8E1_9BACT|nr:NUDIX hydrolase [Geobacter argillaceus]TWJ26520.1 8-oxo-dGTP diphosphatase [Geobacter argillaceus]
MPFELLACPRCGTAVKSYRNPFPTVDIIIEVKGEIVLIERKNAPFGWALPGGFVDYGESLEAAAVREALEETSLAVRDLRLIGCYSDPGRDPRQHNISTVFAATADAVPMAGDDATRAALYSLQRLPSLLCFDHDRIIRDFISLRESGLLARLPVIHP